MERRIDDVRPQQGLEWDAKGAAMDRAGELPMERRAGERRAKPVVAVLPASIDTKLLVDIATAVMEQRGMLTDFTEKGMQVFCEELDAAFSSLAATPALPAATGQPAKLINSIMGLKATCYEGYDEAAWDGYERGFKAAQKEIVALIGAAGSGTALPAEEVQGLPTPREMAIAQEVRRACCNCYSPDDSASDWDEKMGDMDLASVIRRVPLLAATASPAPADTTALQAKLDRAERALIRSGFEDLGGQEWKPPLGKPPRFIEVPAPALPVVPEGLKAFRHTGNAHDGYYPCSRKHPDAMYRVADVHALLAAAVAAVPDLPVQRQGEKPQDDSGLVMPRFAAPAGQHGSEFGGWISIDERTPDEDAEVIVTGPAYGDYKKGRYSSKATFSQGVFFNEDGDDMHEPSHWIAIPATPAIPGGAV